MRPRSIGVCATLLLVACSKERAPGMGQGSGPPGIVALPPIALPGGSPGIGFDDLRFLPELGRVVAPGGRSGTVFEIDPATLAVSAVQGFSATPKYAGGHDDGPTSADEGAGLVYVTDRTARRLDVVDAKTHTIVGFAALGASPDYVRFVPATHEVWVTEPDAERIEVFSVSGTTAAHAADIPVKGGPESLVIDASRRR